MLIKQIEEKMVIIKEKIPHLKDSFAAGFSEYYQIFTAISPDESFLLSVFFDFTSQRWLRFEDMNTHMRYCTHSGKLQRG